MSTERETVADVLKSMRLEQPAQPATRVKDQFTVGDVVKLNSGGSQMTVDTIRGDGYVVCYWHNATGDLKMDAFTPETLTKVAQFATGLSGAGHGLNARERRPGGGYA